MSLCLIKSRGSRCKYQGIRYGTEIREENDNCRYSLHEALERLIYKEIRMTRKEEADKKKKDHEESYNKFIANLGRRRFR